MEEKEMHDFRFKCVGSVTSARTIDAMSIMRHIIMAMTLIFALAMTMLPVGRVSAETLTPTKDFYVVDSANILSEPTKKHIVSVNRDLEKKTGAQIVVATVNSLDGRPIEEYAIDLARSFGIGDRVKNNGVLFLVSKGDREMRIEVGYGLEGRLNDGKCGSIRDKYIVPYLKDDKWDEGVMNGFDALVAEVAAEYDVKVEGARDPEHGGSMTDQFVDWIFDDVIDGSFAFFCFDGASKISSKIPDHLRRFLARGIRPYARADHHRLSLHGNDRCLLLFPVYLFDFLGQWLAYRFCGGSFVT